MATLSIDAIEDALADKGMDAQYTGMDEGTTYQITYGGKMVEILDGVSGEYFREDHLVEAILYGADNSVTNVTSAFEGVETVEEFLQSVTGLLV
jgi:hypothetical protein